MKNEIIGKELNRNSPLFVCVDGGAKGNLTNVIQISCLLGQQYIDGARPHSPYIEDDLFKRRGFCENSFVDGLSPTEYFFHCQAGREGVVSTSMNTPKTGYLQRRLGRFLEDVVINDDGTIREGRKIVSFEC
jgi:DNA-directed RNA polymerase beta' subunit